MIITQSLASKIPIPDFVLNAPVLLDGVSLYYDAFIDLNSCRQVGFSSIGQIPWTAINDYAKRLDLNYEEYYLFNKIISIADAEYLKLLNKTK